MSFAPRRMLRDFYDRALLAPELLCLNCAHSVWNRPETPCSSERREDCILFVSAMVNRLNAEEHSPKNGRRPAPPLQP